MYSAHCPRSSPSMPSRPAPSPSHSPSSSNSSLPPSLSMPTNAVALPSHLCQANRTCSAACRVSSPSHITHSTTAPSKSPLLARHSVSPALFTTSSSLQIGRRSSSSSPHRRERLPAPNIAAPMMSTLQSMAAAAATPQLIRSSPSSLLASTPHTLPSSSSVVPPFKRQQAFLPSTRPAAALTLPTSSPPTSATSPLYCYTVHSALHPPPASTCSSRT